MGESRNRSEPIAFVTLEPPEPIADYNVTGDTTPNCECNYFEEGIFNGEPYYRREDGAYFIFVDTVYHMIAATLELSLPNRWQRDSAGGIEGLYAPQGTYTGDPIVAAGPH